MSELIKLQEAFQNYLMHSRSDIRNSIQNTAKVSAEQRLAIYGNAYKIRLIEALESNFPVLNAYLGADEFYKLGNLYLNLHPSTFKSIRWFGNHLADLLKHEYKEQPFLSELAQIEWTMSLAFDAQDSRVVSVSEIHNLPPEAWNTLSFSLHPSASILGLEWNSAAQWKNISENNAPIEWIKGTSPYNLIIWRRNLDIQFCSLSNEESLAIKSIIEGKSFADLCEGLFKWFGEQAGMQAASYLKGWIEAGLLAEMTF